MISENCCKHEEVEIDYKRPQTKMKKWGTNTGSRPTLGDSLTHASNTTTLAEYTDNKQAYYERKSNSYDETSHPSYPKTADGKCPVLGASPLTSGRAMRPDIDWHGKYIQAQRDLFEDAARWSRRLHDMEVAYAEKIGRLEQQYDKTLEQGFEEAYKLLMAERENTEKVVENGYAEAYEIIQELRKQNAELSTQLALHPKGENEGLETT